MAGTTRGPNGLGGDWHRMAGLMIGMVCCAVLFAARVKTILFPSAVAHVHLGALAVDLAESYKILDDHDRDRLSEFEGRMLQRGLLKPKYNLARGRHGLAECF